MAAGIISFVRVLVCGVGAPLSRRSQRLRAVALLTAACVGPTAVGVSIHTTANAQTTAAVVLTPTAYSVGRGLPVAVAVAGTPTSATDWVSISVAGSASSSYVTSKYLNSSDTAPTTIVGSNPTVTLTSPTTPGQYVYRYYKNNNLTRIAESATFTVTDADTTKPVMSIVTPTDNQSFTATPVTVSGTATDNVGVTSVVVAFYRGLPSGAQYWNGSTWQSGFIWLTSLLGSPGARSTSWSYVFNAPPGGNFGLITAAGDEAGNYVSLPYRPFKIADSADPTGLVTSPTASQVVTATPLTITGTATDNAGIYDVQVVVYRAVNGGQFWNGTTWASSYVSNTATVTTPGASSTTWTYGFNQPKDGGNYYVAALVIDTSYRYTLTSFHPFSLEGTFILTPTDALVTPGAPAAVGINGIPTSTTDWVSISVAGSAPSSYVASKYLNSSHTAPTTIVGPNPTVTFTAPLTPGQYVYRYYKNNNLTLIKESASFTVGNPSISLNVPANVVPGELITGTITNVLSNDIVSVRASGTVVQTLVASPTVSFRAPSAGNYSVVVERNGTAMTSAPFTVNPVPAVSLNGSFKEGFPLNVNLTGTLDSSDRVRIDTLGQADLCAACTDPTINKPAAPSVTFANTPAAGTYQVRILRRDQTIALKTFTVDPLPKPTLTAWFIIKRNLVNGNPGAGCIPIWASTRDKSRYSWNRVTALYGDAAQTFLLNDAFDIEAAACPVNPTAEPQPTGYGYGPGDSASRSFFWQVTNYAPAAGETLTIELGPGKGSVGQGVCGPVPGWCSGIRHNIDIVDVPTGATRIVQTKLHTDFGGLRDTVIGGFAIALKDIQVTPGTACVLPYEQWPAAARNSDYGAFYIPVPPSGNCADAIATGVFVAVDANGVVIPGQNNPDGTWKTITNNPVLTPDPQSPPTVEYTAPIPRYSFLGEGVPAAIESANSGNCLSFDAYCTVFIPELVGAGMWLHPAEDMSLCVTSRSGSVYLDPCLETPL
jgi:Bacterial Ig domain